MIINCIKIANKIWAKNLLEMDLLRSKNIKIKFVAIQVGHDLSSSKFIANKFAKAKFLGIESELLQFDKINEYELIEVINKLNQDKKINGIIVQLPLPKNIDYKKIISKIDLNKNIDGFNFSNNYDQDNCFNCVSSSVMEIFKFIKLDLQGKHVVLINRSENVGKPLIPLLLKENATLTICHSKSKRIDCLIKIADVLIVGVGKKNFIKKNMINPNLIIIDIGITIDKNKIYGDCDRKLYDFVKYITPVPNGVGQLTLAFFFEQLIKLSKQQNQIIEEM